MFLKYLAIEGFKSFPERNSLEMSPGICVLVGANGTGKSNVTDAVSWVLGEDDLAALLCTSQDELIFAGSPELHSLDTARVSLVIDRRPERNRTGSLPLCAAKHGQQAEHEEELPSGALTITREVHRGGTGHYYVNGEECSRQGLHEALRALDISPGPVNTIRQGKLENLLVADPITRRRTIASAAGISGQSQNLHALQEERHRLGLEHEQLIGEQKEILPYLERTEEECRTLDASLEIKGRLAKLRAQALVHAIAALNGGAEVQNSGKGVPSHPEKMAPQLLESLGLPTPREDRPVEEWESLQQRIQDCTERLTGLGPINARARLDRDQARERRKRVQDALAESRRKREACTTHLAEEEEAVQQAFYNTFQRVKMSFAAYYSLLAPGGEADLTLTPGRESRPAGLEDQGGVEDQEGVEVLVRPPGKVLDRVDNLSGGERSLAALALALAVFQEDESPLFILDEVEPALDDTNIRRVQTFLDRVADHRQILLVSHQQRAKETGDVVFGVEQNLDGAGQIRFRYEPRTHRLEVFRRTWTAPHIRKEPRRGGRGKPVDGPAAVGVSGSPTQAALMQLHGPGSGPNRARQSPDGSWQGIWDELEEKRSEDGKGAEDQTPDEPEEDQPQDPGDPEGNTPPQPCC